MTVMRNQMIESRAGWLALALAFAMFLVACLVYVAGCTSSEVNAARWADTKVVLPITESVCEIETATQPPAGWVDVVCSWAEGIEAYLGAAPPDSGVGLAAADVKAPASLRMRITVPRAKQLAAAHPEVLQLPRGL